MKRILIGTVALIMTLPAFGDDGDKTTTSKPYVDTQIETTQVKIPAAGAQGVGEGTSVITYTNTAGGGVIGERGLYTGGNYSAGDADKLITAAALNNTFTNLPTTDTTTLECANPGTCTLWTIIDQTAYGAGSGSGGTDPAILAMLQALVNTTGMGFCYKNLKDGAVNAGNNCTTTPSNYGDWGTMFTYNNEPVQVNGISVCSTLSGTYAQEASDQSQVQSDYESNMSNAPTSSPVGGNCYCKLTNPSTSAARWVFRVSNSVSICADLCAHHCGLSVRNYSDFRGAVFGAAAN